MGIQAFIVKPYEIPSGSMIPTLKIGQRVLVNRLAFKFGDPSVGDIVVFHPPAGADNDRCGATNKLNGETDTEDDPDAPATYDANKQPCPTATTDASDQNFIKRIVAGPGDTIAVKNGHPVVNGKEATNEDFIKACGGAEKCNLPDKITVPPDHYFMMGDNRGNSDDSRYWGPVDQDQIIGKAFFTYWPLDRIGLL